MASEAKYKNTPPTPEEDAENREKACDTENSYIVQAPAGSGKTSLLTMRFLKLLDTVDKPEEIIAITFTRKAAAEMRDRILGELSKAKKQTDYDVSKDFERKLREAAEKVLERDTKNSWRLLDQPNRLRISTIDSLCLQLAKQMPITSEFGAALSPTDDAKELYAEAAHRAIVYLEGLPKDNPLNESYRTIANHCNNNTKKIEDELARLMATREKWLPYLEEGIDNIIAASDIASAKFAEKLMSEIKELFPYGTVQKLASIGSHVLIKDTEEPFYKILSDLNGKEPACKLNSLNAWGELISSIYNGNIRKQLPRNTDLPKKEMDEFKGILESLEFLNANEKAKANFNLLLDLSNAIPSENANTVIKAILNILRPALEKLREVFGEKKSCDHAEFSINARKALRDLDTGLGEKLDYKIKHILIDEYQDTSEAQYEFANLLTQGWTQGDGRTIFMVGDPMQSIYRFRNAEVGVYLHTKEKGLEESQIKPMGLRLSQNFRSAENTVRLFNDLFKNLFGEEQNEHKGAIEFAEAIPVHKTIDHKQIDHYEAIPDDASDYLDGSKENGSFTPAIITAAENSAEEARIIFDIIKNELEDNEANPDFRLAVLVRSRTAITDLIPYFEDPSQFTDSPYSKEDAISFQAVEIHKLSTKTIISDLMSLTKAIINPGDKIALLSLLRSPWCGLSLKELYAITHKNGELLDTPDLGNLEAIGEEVRHRAELLRSTLQSSCSARAYMSLRDLTEAAWIKLGGPAAPDCTSADLRQAELYFSTLAKLENEKTLVSPEDIDEAIEELFALPDITDDAKKVQIMTIHKAKGLEFNTIILPRIDKETKPKIFPLINFMETENGLLIGLTRKDPDGKNLAQYFLKARDDEKDANELKRLLYVALTRAKGHIFITGQKKLEENDTPKKTTLLSLLSQTSLFVKNGSDEEACQEKPDLKPLPFIKGWNFQKGHEMATLSQEELLQQLLNLIDNPVPCNDFEPEMPSDWKERWLKEIKDKRSEQELSKEEVPLLGTVVHRYFALIAEEGLEKWTKARLENCKQAIINSLIRLGTDPQTAEKHAAHILKVLKASLESNRARWILGAHDQAACEMRITGPLGDNEDLDEDIDLDKNRIIDRTFVDNGIRWIIDYKTGQRTAGESDDKFAKRKLDGRIGDHQTYREQLESYATLLSNAGETLPIKLALYFPFTNADNNPDDPQELFIEWEPKKKDFSTNPQLT